MNPLVSALAGVVVAPVILIGAATGALTGAGAVPVDVAAPTEAAATAIGYARAQLGVPYRWGEETPGVGFDCSGLAWAAYAAAGVALPRTAQTQYDAGPLLPQGTPPEPGDLVFFGTADRVHHVGLVIDSTQMIAAPHTGAVVRIQPFAARDLLGFSRPSARPSTSAEATP